MWPITGLLKGPGFLRRGCGPVGSAFSSMEDSECVVDVQAPSLALVEWGACQVEGIPPRAGVVGAARVREPCRGKGKRGILRANIN